MSEIFARDTLSHDEVIQVNGGPFEETICLSSKVLYHYFISKELSPMLLLDMRT